MGHPCKNFGAAVVALWLAAASAADAPPPDPASTEAPLALDPVVTVAVASRLDRPRDDVVGAVDVILARDLDAHAALDASDLLRYLPGASLEGAGTRFGDVGFRLRGVGGDRVAVELDGIPLNDHFAVGAFANATRDLLDPELVRRVEVLRGPASTLYGSDALGGVVAISTKRPRDLLTDGARAAGSVRVARATGDDADALAASGAFAAGDHALLLGASWRASHQQGGAAPATVPDDPQDRQHRALLASYAVGFGDGSQLELIAQHADERVATDVRSLLGRGRYNTTTELTGDDRQARDSAIARWEFGERWGLTRGALRGWWMASDFDQATVQVRGLAAPPTREERRFLYSQEGVGIGADLEARIEAPLAQRIGFGFAASRVATSERRDGRRIDLNTLAVSSSILGENFPVRDFPDSRTEELGAYLLDELEIGDRLTLIPGLRYDRFRLAPQPDAIYAADNPATTPTALDDDALSAKLALAWQASEALDLYLQYAEGFRAPPFEDVNIGLDIALFGYRAIPNPDLQPEDSAGLELGARWVVPGTRASVAVFSTDYRDLIESKVNLGVDPLSGRTIFQSQNRARARIRGAEASIEHQRPASWGARWLLRAALSWAEGEDLTSGEPLNSVDPGELLAAAALEAGDGRWRVELVGTAVDGKDQVDDPASGRLFRTPGYGLLDLYLSRRIGRRLTLTLGVRNLTDRAYWRWAAVNGLLDNDPVVDLVAAPGRSATLALRAAL